MFCTIWIFLRATGSLPIIQTLFKSQSKPYHPFMTSASWVWQSVLYICVWDKSARHIVFNYRSTPTQSYLKLFIVDLVGASFKKRNICKCVCTILHTKHDHDWLPLNLIVEHCSAQAFFNLHASPERFRNRSWGLCASVWMCTGMMHFHTHN